ncbi:CIS tube protein [Paenibacillus agricola]|uniref:LysM peptidoglycan-binding domain-containing protein n=1 Tax=Paenibacillus agricola TaxID=2716264 RepID=A0ABX0J7S6_9BACL|nr:LysM peptidoglycan-binding domain-containing protein [Paenibacillus agricola]NHN32420.1 LysM peptidoglycan-binding domain-containing protein [Paenibacillus agricola]
MALKKAKIIAYKKKGEETIEVLFNPNEYALDTSNNYTFKKVPNMGMPMGQFVNGGTTSLSMDLFFDTYEKGTDVRDLTKQIAQLLDIDVGHPPFVRFVWGSIDFKGVLEKVSQKFTMFLDSGIPVRATLKVTFKSNTTQKEQAATVPPEAAGQTKQKMVKEGDQLWMTAYAEYQDPKQWRGIADANGIDNPRKLKAGRRITVPKRR